ncbi:MoxR family ATPase [Thermosipho ferrireducens]|uniref:MoxR family ATPase n=1 Tax=Thermosipho ferrireducens TaxID=2571116 RepID=A0ABX7SAD7_9BACT|nr:MoxR family ATPase [Thermosipho ferrireducens]QTA38900.1 MoxR family ATPase [Thermosipho ferrireducens]
MFNKIKENIEKVIKGKEEKIKILLTALLAQGHVLIEDVPGVGKTMLAKAIAKTFDLKFKRIQFTPDLLPTDLTGLYIYNKNSDNFTFKPGPIFTDVLLADEINRATPRTQSALLEAMEEKQVTIDGKSHKLSNLFFTIATQNPIESEGTFPLPEAQLDRFIIKLSMGYPDFNNEIEMLKSQEQTHPIEQLKPIINSEELNLHIKNTKLITISDSIFKYIVRITEATRNHPSVEIGASPRASIALMKMARAFAYLDSRDFVLPDDVKTVAPFVLTHRLILTIEAKIKREKKSDIIEEILDTVKVVE